MTKIEMLFIRACKSTSPSQRLSLVYRHFYGNYVDNEWYIVGILINICNKYTPIDVLHLVSELNPILNIYTPLHNSYAKQVLYILYTHIRFIEFKKLPEDFIRPIRCRRLQ